MIAILGATGYIGRSLSRTLLKGDPRPVTLFAREPARLADEAWPARVELRALDTLDAGAYGLVINALGAGDPRRVAAMGVGLLEVTQAWDTRVLATMGPETRYVFLSSGAVYGTFEQPVTADSTIELPLNRLDTVSPYTAAKLVAELRHRAAPDRAILDLRVFGYSDPAIPLNGSFFLAELARSVARGEPFLTSSADMIRDYAGASELCQLILCWDRAGAPNAALDLYTRAPVSKLALLSAVRERFGTEIRFADRAGAVSPTGSKSVYASSFRRAAEFGYAPSRDAAEIVLDTLNASRRG